MKFFMSFFFYKNELTALHIACKIGSTNIVSLLLQNESIDINSIANVFFYNKRIHLDDIFKFFELILFTFYRIQWSHITSHCL